MTDELIKVTGEAAQVVKRIFTLCMEGRGPVQIAKVGRKGAQSHGLQAPAGPQDAQQGRRTTGTRIPLSACWSGGKLKCRNIKRRI